MSLISNKKDKPEAKLLERHRLSVCDIRHLQAKKIELELVYRITKHRQELLAAKQQRFNLLSFLPFAENRTKDQQNELNFINNIIADLSTKHHALVTEMYKDLQSLTLVKQAEVNNIIPTAGRSVIAKWIIGDNTYDADDGANYGSLGTGITTPANGNTQINTETYRKLRSSEAQSSNVATLSNFYTATEVSGTIEEAGWHIAGTASANSGQLLSHFLTGTISKTLTETLTVESVLTIS